MGGGGGKWGRGRRDIYAGGLANCPSSSLDIAQGMAKQIIKLLALPFPAYTCPLPPPLRYCKLQEIRPAKLFALPASRSKEQLLSILAHLRIYGTCAARFLLQAGKVWMKDYGGKMPDNPKEKAVFQDLINSWWHQNGGIFSAPCLEDLL
jgi:hypothetical protein